MKGWKALSIMTVLFAMVLTMPLFAAGKKQKESMEMGKGKGIKMRMGMEMSEFPFRFLLRQDIVKEIGLTDEQQEKLRKLVLSYEKEQIKTNADIQIAELELRDLMEQDNPNIKEVDKKIDEVGKLRIAAEKDKIHLMLDAKKILTPGQIERIQSLMRERMQERTMEKGERGGGKDERLRGEEGPPPGPPPPPGEMKEDIGGPCPPEK